VPDVIWWSGERIDVLPPAGTISIADRGGCWELAIFTNDKGAFRIVMLARYGLEECLFKWRQFCWKQGRAPVPPSAIRHLPEFCTAAERASFEKA
jgi:hypothetical protein